jgi:hypothetical protein
MTMNTRQAILKSDGAQSIKYAWVAVLTLVAILIAGLLAPAYASSIKAGDLPFGLQSGLTTAHLGKDGRFIGKTGIVAARAAEKDLPFGLQSGLFTAQGVGYREPLVLVGGKGLPFGLQSGLVTARGVGFRDGLAQVGGKGVPVGLQSGLLSAHRQSDGAELGR